MWLEADAGEWARLEAVAAATAVARRRLSSSSVCSERRRNKRVNIFRVFFSTLLAVMAARCKTVRLAPLVEWTPLAR